MIAPGLNVMTQSEADNLSRYVKQGGHLVLGQRSGMKDEENSRWPQRQPGPLVPLLGARVEQYISLNHPVELSGTWDSAKAQLFAEQITPLANDVRILMRYHAPNSWLDGQPAAVTRKIGGGSISYIGVWPDEAGMKRAVQWMVSESGVRIPSAPPQTARPYQLHPCFRWAGKPSFSCAWCEYVHRSKWDFDSGDDLADSVSPEVKIVS